jgi:hypothetical protein
MGEVQIDVIEPELREALGERLVRLVAVVAVVPQLRRDEQLVARDAARGGWPSLSGEVGIVMTSA